MIDSIVTVEKCVYNGLTIICLDIMIDSIVTVEKCVYNGLTIICLCFKLEYLWFK